MSETPRKKEGENILMINLQQTDSSSREDLSDTGSSPLRRSRAETDRKTVKKDLKEKKRKSKLEKYVAKAVFEIQTDFDYEDLISVTYKKILRVFMRLTGSEFGYIAEVKPQNKEPEFLQSSFNNVLFRCVIDGSENLDLRQEEQYNPIASLLTDPKNISGAAIHSKEILLSNGDLDPSAATPSVNERQYSIPELQILGRASLKNFVGIPLLQRKKRNQESTIIGIIGIGNKLNGFSMEFIRALKPFLTTCETLIQAYNNYRIVNKQFADAEQLQSLTLLIRNPETGFVLKDRKYHLKTYKNCFIGKESVTWILENCEYLGVKTREDALKLGQQLMDMKAFQHVTRDHSFEDEAQYYVFTDEPPEEDRPTTPENKVRVRSSSFVFNLLGTPPVASPAVNQDRLELHAIVMKRDAYSLRKKLSKKRAIEQLNQVNSDNKTALHIAIENNDYECVELLLKAYRQHIDKADIHIKDRNGYTPLHTASELANEKIIMALLLHPGIQTNIGNNYMNTPFHCFCNKFSSPSSISQLFDLWMQRGTLINSVNKGGETPLHKAILNPTMRAIVARRLVEYGADVNIQNSLNGETPLHYAIHLYRKDLVYILLCGGADPDIRSELVNAELEENQEIAALLNKTRELRAWLDKIQMRNYLPVFIKHLIFLDVLPSVNEKTLIDMEITLAGDRLRILQAIEEYKNELNKRNSNEIVPKNKIRLADLRRKTALHTENPVIIPLPSTPTSASTAENLLMKHLNSKEVNWIKYSDIEFTELLGTGTSGAVYRGFFKGEEVAIKVLEKDKDNKIDEFIHEFKIMNAITGPNIVQFYGACIDPKPVLVMEFCSRGNLYELLSDQQVIFGWKEVLRFSTEMTRALDVLHSHQPPVLHRDLKSPNLLVTKGWSIKMCDFGLSRFSTATMNTFYQLRGTMAYCAPETFEGKLYTDSSDVYSLGIIMWEMLYKCVTGEYQRPYAEYTYITQPFQIIIQAAQRGLRPTIPIADKCPQPFVSLINACWDSDNSRRPTTKQILQALDLCKKDFDEKRDEWNACICHPHVSTATIKEHLGGSDDNN